MIRVHVAALLIVLGVIGAAEPVRAEEPLPLPRYDSASFCAKGGAANGEETSCRRREDQLRVQLDRSWGVLPFQKRHFCVTSVRFMRKELRSYSVLDQCLGTQGIS